jgi:hypothetical protein
MKGEAGSAVAKPLHLSGERSAAMISVICADAGYAVSQHGCAPLRLGLDVLGQDRYGQWYTI